MLQLIVGLGNVGAAYANTRHNAGFWFVERVADRYKATLSHDKKFHGRVGRIAIGGNDVRLLLPDTFMNCSGKAVGAIARFYGVDPACVLVAHDELDIALGLCKLKKGGGHGGHNGLRDVCAHIGADFWRLRLGIDRPAVGADVSRFVLAKPSQKERDRIDAAIDAACDRLEDVVRDPAKAQNALNALRLAP